MRENLQMNTDPLLEDSGMARSSVTGFHAGLRCRPQHICVMDEAELRTTVTTTS